jgi:serine/threonine protein kinase
MMKDSESQNEYAGAIDLIGQMLKLDPEERITAKGGLQHEYMSNYMEDCHKQPFQDTFVCEWISLKNKLINPHNSDDNEFTESGIKRKALLMAASTTEGNDDLLYDMSDLLGGREAKKKKEGHS